MSNFIKLIDLFADTAGPVSDGHRVRQLQPPLNESQLELARRYTYRHVQLSVSTFTSNAHYGQNQSGAN